MSRLTGRKLLLTRSAEESADWARALAAEGATPTVLPCIRSESLGDAALAARLATAVAKADWLVCTSRRGVDAVADLIGTALPAKLKLAAVGAATAARLRERFGRVDRIGQGTARELGRELGADPGVRAGARAVLALAANAGPLLESALSSAGAAVERFDVYRTFPALALERKRPLSGLDCDTVIFASPTAVTGFANQVEVDKSRLFVTIGPSTSAAVRERHWAVSAEAKEPSLAGIIDSMLETSHV